MVGQAPPRRKASPVHAGMILSRDSRSLVIAAMVYLIASAAWIAWHGALVTDGALRGVGIHLFTAGFVLSLIYGLGAHMMPRFTGNPIRSGAVPWVQFALLHGGLPVFLGGIAAGSRAFSIAGAVLVWLSLGVYAWRIWPVLWRERGESASTVRVAPEGT